MSNRALTNENNDLRTALLLSDAEKANLFAEINELHEGNKLADSRWNTAVRNFEEQANCLRENAEYWENEYNDQDDELSELEDELLEGAEELARAKDYILYWEATQRECDTQEAEITRLKNKHVHNHLAYKKLWEEERVENQKLKYDLLVSNGAFRAERDDCLETNELLLEQAAKTAAACCKVQDLEAALKNIYTGVSLQHCVDLAECNDTIRGLESTIVMLSTELGLMKDDNANQKALRELFE